MRKIPLAILLILLVIDAFSQNIGGLTTATNEKELHFQSVGNSFKNIKKDEINNYKIIDTITNPEAYLIQDFENISGTISIAVKNKAAFKVYNLFPTNSFVNDTLNANETNNKFRLNRFVPYSNILEVKRIKLDKFKSEELVLKFSYRNVFCPDCNQSQASITKGYIIFDFDKLHHLKIINLQTILLAQQLNEFENFENFKVDFRKNYVKINEKKYFYSDNKLIRK